MNLHLAQTIKKLRRDKNLTQENVAAELGVSFQAVSRWENGQAYPDIELLPSIAALFGVSLDKLFGTDPESEEAIINRFESEYVKALESYTDSQQMISLVKKYISELPGSGYLKFRLLQFYHDEGAESAAKHLDEMRHLCRDILEHIENDNMQECYSRECAISCMIDVEDDDNVDEWYNLLDKKSYISSSNAELNRYNYRDDVDKFNYAVQAHLFTSMVNVFWQDFCKRDKVTTNNAHACVEGQKIILKIIDILRDPSVEVDAWINERIFVYCRLAGPLFYTGNKEEGYAAMEKSIDLCFELAKVPIGSTLTYNSPALDLLSDTVKKSDAIEEFEYVYDIYTRPSGWAWFDCVRGEERYAAQLARLKEYIDANKE